MTDKTSHKPYFSMFVSGLLFGLGLTISGMVNPGKIIAFLDVAGNWDPSLILVMAAGLSVTVVSFRFILKQDKPLLEEKFYLPTKTAIDTRLVLGAVLFGLGWGLAGLCPGPALVGIVTLNSSVILFVGSMVLGMLIHRGFMSS